MKAIIAYVPVIHQGYFEFFRRHCAGDTTAYVLGDSLLAELTGRPREIRALTPSVAAKILHEAFWFNTGVHVLETPPVLWREIDTLIVPDELISRTLVKKYFVEYRVVCDRVFLRHEEGNVTTAAPVGYDGETDNSVHLTFMDIANRLGAVCSSDWWRQLGCLAVRDGKVLASSYNHHPPSDYSQYINGDPRDVIAAGAAPHIATALHAERALVAQAASEGIALKGADIYQKFFPCPDCAHVIAEAGIKTVYFQQGNAYLRSDEVLRELGVKMIRVIAPR